MQNKPLLLWGLGAGIIALVAFIVGYAFVWPADDDEGCRIKRDGEFGMMKDGRGGMIGEDGCVMMRMMEGMMGEVGMMSYVTSGGMMGSPVDAATAPISIDQAADAARRYVTDQGNTDLKVTRILEFTNGFYVRVGEQSTGTGAYELRIDRNSGDVSRTTGPGTMWNRKYEVGIGGIEGMMGEGGILGCTNGDDDEGDYGDSYNGMEGMYRGNMSWNDGTSGMMGSGGMMDSDGIIGSGTVNKDATTADMTIKSADAGSRAQKYADSQFPGSKVSNPDMFYGYYTVDITKDGRVLALISVNGYSGQVWLQTWPGSYLGAKAL